MPYKPTPAPFNDRLSDLASYIDRELNRLAPFTTQQGIGAELWPLIEDEDGVDVVNKNYYYGDVRRYGASVVSTDNSIALQRCVDFCGISGHPMYVPQGVFPYATGLTYTRTGSGGIYIYGHATSDYNTALTRGSVLSYTGSGHGFTFDGNQAPIHSVVKDVALLGTSSATSGWRIRRATNLYFSGCTAIGFSGSSAAAWLINPTATEYCGVIDFNRCIARSCYYPWWLVKTPITVVNWDKCETHGACNNGIVFGENGVAANFRHFNIRDCEFETNVSSDVLSWVQMEKLTIDGCYIENNQSAETDPRIYIRGVANKGITIRGLTLVKQLANATDRHIDINDADGVYIWEGNYSAYPTAGAAITDRYSVQLSASCTNLFVEPPSVVDGATAYPIRYGSTNYNGRLDTISQLYLGAGAAALSFGANDSGGAGFKVLRIPN